MKVGVLSLAFAAAIGLAATAARGDVITTYTFSNTTVEGGGEITGSFQIDQTTYNFAGNTGYVAGSSTIEVTGDSVSYVNGSYSQFYGYNAANYASFINLPGPGVVLELPIGTPPRQSGSIDLSNGAGFFLSYAEGVYEEMTGDLIAVTTTVPEPSTWALMLLGFAGLGVAAHRRAKTGRAVSHVT